MDNSYKNTDRTPVMMCGSYLWILNCGDEE